MHQTDRIDSLPSGSELHGYLVDRVLGSGAFGITYLANHQHLGSKHVIKEYLPDCAMREHNRSTVSPKSVSDRDLFTWGLKSFFDEAKLLHQLSHPHIVKVTDLFVANGTAYFVMPYLRGITLHEWMKKHPGPSQSELEAIFVPLLEGLKYIHDKNLLHRDVKPENIYILENGHPILIDFGSARIAIGQKSKALTQVLTPHFAPHEQYRTKGTFTPALDLYGIAACVYQAITGELPEEAPNRIEEDLQPRLVGSLYEGRYNSNFLRAIDKSLSVYAKDRHQDGFAFQKDLLGQYNQPVDATGELPHHIHSKTDNVSPGTTAPADTIEQIPDKHPVNYDDELNERDKKVSPVVWAVLVVAVFIFVGVFWPRINAVWQASPEPSVSQRFKDNGNGTVTDTRTGLMWTKDANPFGRLYWDDAMARCRSYSISGISGWHLPSRDELQAIYHAMQDGHPFTGVQSSYYWSSTTHVGGTYYAWHVNLDDGDVYYNFKSSTFHVWPVRAGQ